MWEMHGIFHLWSPNEFDRQLFNMSVKPESIRVRQVQSFHASRDKKYPLLKFRIDSIRWKRFLKRQVLTSWPLMVEIICAMKAAFSVDKTREALSSWESGRPPWTRLGMVLHNLRPYRETWLAENNISNSMWPYVNISHTNFKPENSHRSWIDSRLRLDDDDDDDRIGLLKNLSIVIRVFSIIIFISVVLK